MSDEGVEMADLTQTRMTVAEFLELPESNQIIELVEGEVVVNPPKDPHQAIVGNAYFLVRQITNSGTIRVAPTGVYVDEINFYEPDVFWVSESNSKCLLKEDGYWYGPPDLVIEVLSPGTQHKDRGAKFRRYQQHGVRELWLVDPVEQYVEVFTLQDGTFIQQGLYTSDTTFTSQVLKQSIEVKALFENA